MSRILYALSLFALVALACNAPSIRPPDSSGEQVAVAATRAAEAAAIAATTAAEAAAAAADNLATVQSIDPGQIDVPLDPTAVSAFLDQIDALDLSEDGQFTLTLTEEQINTAIALRQASEETPPRLQNVSVTLDDGLIVVSGDVTSPVQGRLVVQVRPAVVDGRLQFEAVGATFGNITVPSGLLDSAVALLNNTIGQSLAVLPAGLAIQSAVVADGILTLVIARE